jgi:hypothetical protein
MLSYLSARRMRWPIGSLALLLALFGWGLEYKISLYHHGKPSHSTANPPAKLLTEAERRIAPKGAITSAVLVSPIRVLGAHALVAEYGREQARAAGSFLHVFQDAPARYRLAGRFFIRPPPLS